VANFNIALPNSLFGGFSPADTEDICFDISDNESRKLDSAVIYLSPNTKGEEEFKDPSFIIGECTMVSFEESMLTVFMEDIPTACFPNIKIESFLD